jgi:hypothetical protein
LRKNYRKISKCVQRATRGLCILSLASLPHGPTYVPSEYPLVKKNLPSPRVTSYYYEVLRSWGNIMKHKHSIQISYPYALTEAILWQSWPRLPPSHGEVCVMYYNLTKIAPIPACKIISGAVHACYDYLCYLLVTFISEFSSPIYLCYL